MGRARREGMLVAAGLLGGLMLGGTAWGAEGDEAKLRGQIDTALANIQHAHCGGAGFCDPATPDEIAAPPVSAAEAAQVLGRGIVSGFANSCAMDWRQLGYQPMVDYWRARGKSDRQVALLGILHGMSFGRTQAAIGNKPCTAELRQDIRAQLSRFP